MRKRPLVQPGPIDVSSWKLDEDFGIYPEGARDKAAHFAPSPPPEDFLIAERRYLFKHSRKEYREQFWTEVVAYRVACLLGMEAPPAFAAWNSKSGVCGALIEWFFVDGQEASVLGGDLLQRVFPNFDRQRGSTHNIQDNARLLRAMTLSAGLQSNWRAWWMGAVMFDALIGNTDRHQDNWSFVFKLENGRTAGCRLSPYFDNGTSLGSELDLARISQWTDQRFDRYINNGMHHVRWKAKGEEASERVGHIELVRRLLPLWPQVVPDTAKAFQNVSADDLSEALKDLPSLDLPVPLSQQRLELIVRLLARRLHLLQEAINEHLEVHR